jgi:hypothetical protein
MFQSFNPVAAERPSPPGELSPPEAMEWNRIVDRLPADFFPAETHAMLRDLVQAICMGQDVADQIKQMRKQAKPAAMDPDTFSKFDKLLRLKLQLSVCRRKPLNQTEAEQSEPVRQGCCHAQGAVNQTQAALGARQGEPPCT